MSCLDDYSTPYRSLAVKLKTGLQWCALPMHAHSNLAETCCAKHMLDMKAKYKLCVCCALVQYLA
jgi:hypothetical protein